MLSVANRLKCRKNKRTTINTFNKSAIVSLYAKREYYMLTTASEF